MAAIRSLTTRSGNLPNFEAGRRVQMSAVGRLKRSPGRLHAERDAYDAVYIQQRPEGHAARARWRPTAGGQLHGCDRSPGETGIKSSGSDVEGD
jgi:hypothetical protein